MPKQILIISTLDTKGVETLYLKQKIEALGSLRHPHGSVHAR